MAEIGDIRVLWKIYHVSSIAEIIEMFERNGIKGNRNVIREDVKVLNEAGFEILNVYGKP